MARRGSPSIPSVPPPWSSAMIKSRLGRSTGFRSESGPARVRPRRQEQSQQGRGEHGTSGMSQIVFAGWVSFGTSRSRSVRQAGLGDADCQGSLSDPITSMPESGAPSPVRLSGAAAMVSGGPMATTRPPAVAGFGAQVDHPVGRGDHVEVVLDDDDGVAQVGQAVEDAGAGGRCRRSAARWSARRGCRASGRRPSRAGRARRRA